MAEAHHVLDYSRFDRSEDKILRTSEETPEHLRLRGKAIRVETPNGLVSILPVDDGQAIGEKGATVSNVVLIDPDKEWEISSAVATLELEEMRTDKRNNLVGILLATIGMAATAIAGCGPNPNSSDGDSYSAYKAPLSPEDLENLGTQLEACFSEPGDIRPNIGIFNGEVVVTFIRDNHCYYVRAADIVEALTTECTADLIDLPGFLFPGDFPVSTCAIHEDKIYYQKGGEPAQEAGLVDNAGLLVAQNNQYIPEDAPHAINTGTLTIVVEDGIPFLLYRLGGTVRKLNLNTDHVTDTVVDAACEVPHMDPDTDVWVGARPGDYGGGVSCKLIQAPTLEALQSSLQFIPGIMVEDGSLIGDSKNPRIFGEVMIFEGREKDPDNPGDLLPSGIYYALVTEYCGDGTCDGTETSVDCPADCDPEPFCGDGSCDVGINEDINNCPVDCAVCGDDICTDPPETDANCAEDCTPDPVCGDGACTGDETLDTCGIDCAVCGDGDCTDPPETSENCAEDCTPDPFCGDGDCNGDETTATCPEDCPAVDPCDAFIDDGRITFVEGQELCEMTDCVDEDPFGESFIVEGNCSFEIDFGYPEPVEFSIFGAEGSPDGAVHIDFLENAAHELLRGGEDVQDNGNHHGSMYSRNGNMIELGAEGTGYIAREATMPGTGRPGYYAECTEGIINLYKNGELIATLTEGETKLIDVGEDIDPDGGTDGTDGGDDGTDGGDDGTDGSVDGTDGSVDGSVDGSADEDGENPPGCGDCSTSNSKIPAGELAFIGMMLLALTRRMRREREKSLREKSKRMPGLLLASHIRNKVGRLLGGSKES